MNPELPGELEFLSRLGVLARPAPPGWVGPGDDGAVIPFTNGKIAFSADLLVEKVHFRRETASPEEVGYKALAVNLSDMAAMGAHPLAATVTLTVPPDVPTDWFARLYFGMDEAASAFTCPVAGGDLSRGSEITISVAIIGRCEAKPLLRSGAKPGDDLWVTGAPGESGAGFRLLQSGATGTDPIHAHLIARHLRPTPRVGFGTEAARLDLATAMIDVSDGIGRDALNLALSSKARVVVEADLLPLSAELETGCSRLGLDPVSLALGGGEDYELLFTATPGRRAEIEALSKTQGLKVTKIGRVEEGEGRVVVGADGLELADFARGYDHFTAR